MRIRCPNCNSSNPTRENGDLSGQDGVHCPACGEQYYLVDEDTRSFRHTPEQMIGHFRLLKVVGRGAFGVVWRAHDTELDRIVAVKIPRNPVAGVDEANQFIREAQTAAQLKHAHIVTVHEVGVMDDFIYIVSDFIDGITLSDWLSANRPTSRESAELCLKIAEALAHAHQVGVIHRDMKPGNILMDAYGSPNIADFGLAKREVGDTTVTFDGQIVGTPAYMSPEQAMGLPADRRSDIYSMGVILFEFLTGEKPFRGNHRMLMYQVVNDEPPSPKKLNASIPRDLETICLKCLENNPQRRYQNAQELGEDLQRYLDGEPILARPIRTMERVWKWAARRPQVASLLAAFVLAVVLGLSGVIWQWQRVLASQRRQASTQVELIRQAEARIVESAIAGLSELREWADPELRKVASDEVVPVKDRFRCQLALLEIEPDRAGYVVDQLLRAEPMHVLDFDELALGTDVLAKAGALPRSRLIELAGDVAQEETLRFRAVFMLARTADLAGDGKEPWEEWTPFIVQELVARATLSPEFYSTLVDTFRPVQAALLPEFRAHLGSEAPKGNERFTAVSIVGEYAQDQPEYLCELLFDLQPEEYSVILPRLHEHREFTNARFAKLLSEQPGEFADQQQKDQWIARKVVASVTLLHLNDEPPGVWPLLKQSPDMSLRTGLVHRFAALGLPPEKLTKRLRMETDASVRRAILLALGEYDRLDEGFRNDVRPLLEDLYRQDPDAGIHSAVAWLLESWGESKLLRAMDREPAFTVLEADRQWYVNSQGSTMVIIDHPPVFLMGPAPGEPSHTFFDRQHLRNVERKYAIASTELTWEQFQKFVDEHPEINHSHPEDYGPYRDGPVLAVSWVQAAKYCRWLSEEEGIPPDQMCFPGMDEIEDGMQLPANLMDRMGYRLASEGEWECACRTGTITRRFFGDSENYLGKYGWHIGNSNDFAWQVGRLKPNDYGLFDVYGNAWEWCLDRHGKLPTRPQGQFYPDKPKLDGTTDRILRGGSMNSRTDALRSAQRDYLEATHNRNHNVGFRIARTLAH